MPYRRHNRQMRGSPRRSRHPEESTESAFRVPRVHCSDRSVPTPVTDSGDDRPILGHGNGFAKLHAHDGVVGARKGAATTVVTISGARCS